MSNRYSTFPDALDQLKLLSEVQEMTGIQKQKVARYSELALKTSFTGAEEVEFQTLYQDLKGFQLNSSDWNKVVETLMNTQKYIKETVLGDVSVLVNQGETTIQNKVDKVVLDVSTTAENAKSYINKVLVDTEVELNNKISQIVSNGTAGIDYFKGRVTLTLDTTYVRVNVPQYNRTTDFLMVYVNGGLIVEGVNFIIRPDNFTIESIGGNWIKNTIFDFVVLKRTIVTLQYYDAGLFEDGTIRKEKLTLGLKSEITNATNKNIELDTNKQNKIDNNLTTVSKEVVGSINELENDKQSKTDDMLDTTNKTIVGAINELNNAKLGDIRFFATNAPDNTWLLCDGSVISKVNYPELTTFLGAKQYPLSFISNSSLQLRWDSASWQADDLVISANYFKRNGEIYIVSVQKDPKKGNGYFDDMDRYFVALSKYDRGTNKLIQINTVSESNTNGYYLFNYFGLGAYYLGGIMNYDLLYSISSGYTSSSSIMDKAIFKIMKVSSSPSLSLEKYIVVKGSGSVNLMNQKLFYYNNYFHIFASENNVLYYLKLSYSEYESSVGDVSLLLSSGTIVSSYDSTVFGYSTIVDNEVIFGSNSTSNTQTSMMTFNLDTGVHQKVVMKGKFVMPFFKQTNEKYGIYYSNSLLRNIIYKVNSQGIVSDINLSGIWEYASINKYYKDYYNDMYFLSTTYNGTNYLLYSKYADFREWNIFENFNSNIGTLLDSYGILSFNTTNLYSNTNSDNYITITNYSGGNGDGSLLPDIEGGTAYIKAKEV